MWACLLGKGPGLNTRRPGVGQEVLLMAQCCRIDGISVCILPIGPRGVFLGVKASVDNLVPT